MAGAHTLNETERQVSTLLRGMKIDFKAMAVVSNLFRASSAVRKHLEREVLSKYSLSWTGFVVLWVVWVWVEIETREIAEEVGTSKATLTGVLKTLERDKLITKRQSKSDRRLVLVTLTAQGKKLMERIFPEFNKEEVYLASSLRTSDRKVTADGLRTLTLHAESGSKSSQKTKSKRVKKR